MPLINGERFIKTRPPSTLKPDDEVFFCPVTLEIFTDYNEYIERTILVNSTTWHCAICGRGPITYTGAVQCENTDTRQLNAFDSSLAAGLLHIIESAKCKRLPDLVELLCNFATNRFFIGELVEFPMNKARHLGTVRQVLLSAGRPIQPIVPRSQPIDLENFVNTYSGPSEKDVNTGWNDPGGLAAANHVIYCITDNRRTEAIPPPQRSNTHSTGPFFFPAAALQRRGGACLTRDRIKHFVRHTCELSDGFFAPKLSILQRYGLFPHGPLTWRDLYLSPEPSWVELMKYYNSLTASITRPIIQSFVRSGAIVASSHGSLEALVSSQLSHGTAGRKQLFPRSCNSGDSAESDSCSTNNVVSDSLPSSGSCSKSVLTPAMQEQLERGQRSVMERDWLQIRRREDLELTDLVPLPDLPEADFSSKRAVMSIPPIMYSAASVVAAAEVGAPFSLSVMSSGCSADWSALFDDLLLAPGGVSVNTLKLLRDTGSAARLNELVAIPYLYLWNGACRSSRTLQQQLNEAVATTRKEEPGSGPAGPSKTTYSRAVTLAALNGATALCTLDRLGLTSVIRLYITTAAARGGCWRAPPRSCIRPLDDPAFMLCREHGDLLRKLDTVSIYDLTAEEKLILLNCLVDQLLLHPTVRDHVDLNIERHRIARFRLRSFRPVSKVASITTQPEESTVAATTAQLNRSTNAKPSTELSSPIAQYPAHDHSSMSGRVSTTVSIDDRPPGSKDGTKPAFKIEDATHAERAASATLSFRKNPLTALSSDADGSPEHKLQILDELFEASRGSTMLPLGQDRFCRRYWLLLSVPCVLVEDNPSTAEHPLALSPILLSRQVAAFHPDVSESLGLTSAQLATLRLREFITQHPNIPREAVTQHICIQLPAPPMHHPLTMEQLKMLVYPERATEKDLPIQTSSPAATQTNNIRLAHQRIPVGSSIWSILAPFSGPIPSYGDPFESTCEAGNVKKDPNGNVEHSSSMNSTECEVNLEERAAWSVDCLEATLNPRGVRESRLRRVINELRPLLIRVVAQCPSTLVHTSQSQATSPIRISRPAPTNTIAGFWSRPTFSEEHKPTEHILLNWLELSLRRMATRLGLRQLMHDCFNIASGTTAASSTASVLNDKQLDKVDDEATEALAPVQPEDCVSQLREKTDSVTSPPISLPRLQQLARTLLLFGQAIGPKALHGPLSNDSRTARIVPASDPSVSPTSFVVPNLMTGRLTSDPGDSEGTANQTASSYYTTTGWERWCSHVTRAQSASQVYLLARSLERCVRRTLLYGYALRLNTPAFEQGGYLPPKMRCTACSRARPRHSLSTRRQGEKSHRHTLNSKAFQIRGLVEADVRNTVGYVAFQSPLANQGAMRAESSVGSLYLCRTCLRAAGQNLPRLTIPTRSFFDSDSDDDRAFTGDEDWDKLSNESGDRNSTQSSHSDSSGSEMELPTERKSKQASSVHSQALTEISEPSERELSENENSYVTTRFRRRRCVARVSPVAPSPDDDVLTPHLGKRRSNSCRRAKSSSDPSEVSTPKSLEHPPTKRSRTQTSVQPAESNSDSLKDIMVKFPTLKHVSIILHPLDLSTKITNLQPASKATARRGRPLSRRCSASSTRPTIPQSDCIDDLLHSTTPSFRSRTATKLDQQAVEMLLTELCRSHIARPLLRCGAGRPNHSVLTEQNEYDSCDEFGADTKDNHSSTRKLLPSRLRRRPARLNDEPIREQLFAWDLSSLQDLVTQGQLPGGPQAALRQLRLLIKHWLLTNRPGSRIHESALSVSAILDSKLADLNNLVT
ncbi:hypothetical protein D915_001217 [Fasciola hepatica]|uniref:WAC domain-containing protein n=1 Tax=Fasciola hepatica TaxID=6192 RepID=A0A4E0S3Q2_FASHE|nr:hypothetical protein D915_001217 [Fasciola hepatica]